MTSQGSPYARFRRAISRGHAQKAIAAGHELRRINLADALDLVFVLAAAGDRRYEAAARRWLERLAAERRPSLNEVAIAGAALAELGRAPASEVARETLEQLAA